MSQHDSHDSQQGQCQEWMGIIAGLLSVVSRESATQVRRENADVRQRNSHRMLVIVAWRYCAGGLKFCAASAHISYASSSTSACGPHGISVIGQLIINYCGIAHAGS
ncbi:hypothetical protein [Undibacterium sp. Ren11W]|uniref:hypothetical protein n=1 Tax=Undibacterium sp. Ren11W TaxID=3413045 RepID=UPI003BF4D8F7